MDGYFSQAFMFFLQEEFGIMLEVMKLRLLFEHFIVFLGVVINFEVFSQQISFN